MAKLHQVSVHVDCGCGSVLLQQHCDMLRTSNFVDVFITFSHNGPYGTSHVFIIGCCIDSNQILHNDKDHQVQIMDCTLVALMITSSY